MTNTNHLRTGRHCVSELHVHLVFVTKYRKKIFTEAVLSSLIELFQSICQDFESTLQEMNGEADHVHCLITYPPKVALSKLVNSLKGVSSRKLKQQWPYLGKYYWKGALWSPSYFAGSCGGAPLELIKAYIQQQTPIGTK